MAETTVIDTTAEVVEENSNTVPLNEERDEFGFRPPLTEEERAHINLEPEEVHVYTIAAAIDWMKRPENDARIKSMVERAQQAEKTFVQAADREIGKVGRLLIDIGTSDDILEDFTVSLLSSVTGIGR